MPVREGMGGTLPISKFLPADLGLTLKPASGRTAVSGLRNSILHGRTCTPARQGLNNVYHFYQIIYTFDRSKNRKEGKQMTLKVWK